MMTEQRVVAVGAVFGVLAMAVSLWGLTQILPIPLIADTPSDRLAYALRANVIAIMNLGLVLYVAFYLLRGS